METYHLSSDMDIFCVTAESFPDGIQAALDKLAHLIPTCEGRTWMGISRPDESGKIVYKAAVVEAFPGEGASYGCETFRIPPGEYATETIMGWREKLETIGPTFMRLLEHPQLDTNFPCVEWYRDERELLCMVRLDPSRRKA